MAQQDANASKRQTIVPETLSQRPLVKRNFLWMALAGILIVTGFLLMLGGSSTTEQFNPDIFSTRRIVVGPTMAFAGYVMMAVAIFIKPRVNHIESEEETTDGLD